MILAPDQLLSELSAVLGSRGLITDPDLIDPWLTDWRGRYTGRALALAVPASTAEVAAVVRICAQAAVPIVPQGGNSGMSGGATPDTSGTALLLSPRRMTAIRRFDPATRQITCEAGVVLQALHDTVEAEGLRFPLTLGGKGSATVGGLISTNAGGTQVLRHGVMRAQVLGLEAVLPNGEVLDSLTPLRKDNRGPDLKQLFIGAEGTLGIVTAATLRLIPALTERITVWAGVRSIHAARALLLHCEAALGDCLEGFEVVPQLCLEAVLNHLPEARSPLARPDAWNALIEIGGDPQNARDLPDRVETTLADALERGLLDDATIAASEAQAEAFWTLRESISAAERARGPAMQHDISVPVEAMPDFIIEVTRAIAERWPHVRAVGYGHLGDGNIHLHAGAPPGTDGPRWEADEGKAISRLVHDLVTQWGGSISAEHGIGQLKRGELERLADPVTLGLLRSIKAALDPNELFNPGKLVTLAPPPATP